MKWWLKRTRFLFTTLATTLAAVFVAVHIRRYLIRTGQLIMITVPVMPTGVKFPPPPVTPKKWPDLAMAMPADSPPLRALMPPPT